MLSSKAFVIARKLTGYYHFYDLCLCHYLNGKKLLYEIQTKINVIVTVACLSNIHVD